MTKHRLAAACLLAAVLLLSRLPGQGSRRPARKALAGYVAAVDAFAARADKAGDAGFRRRRGRALSRPICARSPPRSARWAPDFPGLANPCRRAPGPQARRRRGGGRRASRLAAAMAKIMVWGYAPAVKDAVAKLAEIEALLR